MAKSIVWFPIIGVQARHFAAMSEQVTAAMGLTARLWCPSIGSRQAAPLEVRTYLPDVLPTRATAKKEDDELIRRLARPDVLRLRAAKVTGQGWRADTPSYLLGLGRRALAYFRRKLDPKQTVAAVFWNGQTLLQRLAEHVCRSRGIAVSFVEAGPIPGTLTVDPAGTGAALGIAARFEKCWGNRGGESGSITVRPELPDTPDAKRGSLPRHARLRSSISCARLAGRALPYDTYSLPPTTRLRRWLTRKAVPTPALGDGPTLLLPLQMRGDTQNATYSGRALPGHVRPLVEAMARLNAAGGPQWRLLIRQHPREDDPRLYRRLRAWLRRFDFVAWSTARSMSLAEAITACSAVFTINSTVGYEAVRTALPTITCGQAFYAIDGVTHRIESPPDTCRVLDAVLYRGDAPPLSRQKAFAAYCESEEFVRFGADLRIIEADWPLLIERLFG